MTIDNTPSPMKPANEETSLRKLLLGSSGTKQRQRWVNIAFAIAFIVIVILIAAMADVFFTQRNLSNLSRQAVTNGLLSLGMLVVIMTGGIDLSAGPIVALTGIMVAGMSKDGMPLFPAILICLLVGI